MVHHGEVFDQSLYVMWFPFLLPKKKLKTIGLISSLKYETQNLLFDFNIRQNKNAPHNAK